MAYEEFHVFHEAVGHLSGPHRSRAKAEEMAETARLLCDCGTDGQEATPGRGDFTCGVLNPHGISVNHSVDGLWVND